MANGQRPGGLVAMAVINFVGLALDIAQLAGTSGMLYAQQHPSALDSMKLSDAQRDQLLSIPHDFLIFTIAVSAVLGVLLLVSGIGYLQQKRSLGWIVGNLYGVVSLGTTVARSIRWHEPLTIMNFVFIGWPLLTLLLLNTTFKRDFE